MKFIQGWLLITVSLAFFIPSLLSLQSTSGQIHAKQTNVGQLYRTQSDLTVYEDTLASGWANWSWLTTADFAHSSTIQSGSNATAVTYTGAWVGLYLRTNSNLISSDYTALGFWIHGGSTGGQSVNVVLYDGAGAAVTPLVSTNVIATANTWTYHEFTIAELGNPTEISGLIWQEATGSTQPVYYLDSIVLLADASPTPTPTPTPLPSAGPALSIDASQVGDTISDHIYGLNFADADLATELDLPINRWGGNAVTRYNWQLDVSNRASDYYFENIPNAVDDEGLLPSGSSSDRFVTRNITNNTDSLITIPMIGWTPKDRAGISCSYSVALYGAQTDTDPWRPDCGNGVLLATGQPITINNPLDIHAPISETFVISWMNHLINNFGSASNGGVRFYNLDNEPMLWHETHRDVHPNGVGYDELRDLTYRYAATIKATDPDAQTLGPVLWGWTAYEYSALDSEPGGSWWLNPLDRNAHGGTPFVEWYLQEMASYEAISGTRILDYLDLHYYPQASGVSLSPVGDTDTQARRLRSTRSLWDPTYTDESWINQNIQMIPRMRSWVDTYYPDTKLAMTEYNWGGLEDINGALAQADVLGIFGREGLDLATLWSPPANNDPGAFAFRMYRNYDGSGSKFGDVSVSASSTDQEQLSIYAAMDSINNRLTTIVINKSTMPLSSTVTFTGVTPGVTHDTIAHVYRYSTVNLTAIVTETDQLLASTALARTALARTGRAVQNDAGFTALFPADSITLFVLDPITASYTLTKTLNTVEPILPGHTLSFTIRITNTGPTTLTQISLQDTFSEDYLSYVLANPLPDIDTDGQLWWDDVTGAGGLAPNESISVIVEFVARQDTTKLVGLQTVNNAATYSVTYDLDEAGPLPPAVVASQSTSDTVQIFAPTAVQLIGINLTAAAVGTLLEWQTLSEVHMSGFHLYRQTLNQPETAQNTLQPLTTVPMTTHYAGTSEGGAYHFVDVTAHQGETYRYVLEIMDLNGNRRQIELGTIQMDWRTFLPLITDS
ncbi:MAG: glycoside hydrolase family 44 protein [Chloroflexota bacterium]